MLPKESTLELSRPSHPYTRFEAKDLFEGFGVQLRLAEQWQRFVAAHQDLFPSMRHDDLNVFREENPVKFSKDKAFPAEHLDLLYQAEEGARSAKILQGYLQFVRDEYVTDIVNQVKEKIERRQVNLTAEIAMMRKSARLAREDEVERLRQDFVLAERQGITENLLISFSRISRSGGDSSNIINKYENSSGYLRGTKALNLEIKTLLKRESDDAFISGLRDKELELEQLKNLQLTTARFQPYTQDGEVIAPEHPAKPKRRLVLALGAVLGLMLGVFAAFFAEFLAKARDEVVE